jgi:hypothetical protein
MVIQEVLEDAEEKEEKKFPLGRFLRVPDANLGKWSGGCVQEGRNPPSRKAPLVYLRHWKL